MSTLSLKILAILFMFTDHLVFAMGRAFFENSDFMAMYYLCRALGRLAMPIFAFLIANGFKHTKNVTRYALRLLGFAIVSEIPFDIFANGKITFLNFSGFIPNPCFDNVFFTLLLGLLFLCARKYYLQKKFKFSSLISAVTLLVLCTFAGFISSDYGPVGVAWVALFGLFDVNDREKTPFLFMGAAILSYWRIISRCILAGIFRLTSVNIGAIPGISYFLSSAWNAMAWIQPFALVSLGIILMYNGKSGAPKNKVIAKVLQYAFYAFYPIHILILYFVFK